PKDSNHQILHLHPLGWESIYPPVDNRPNPILPGNDHAGALLIGLGGTHPAGALTLFFQIRPKSEQHTAGTTRAPHWYYLSSNRWMKLPARHVIGDTTNGFTCSGIVTLDIPRDINRDNTILPDRCFWLCTAVDQDPQCAGHLLGVAAQALSVTWENQDNATDHLQTPLAAGTIRQARATLAGIASIVQPTPSANGRAPEADRTLTTRISERLRHKNRAITPWDYERLVLEQFPEIFKVKCFPGASTAKGMNTAGHVLLVVIAQLESDPPDPDQQPMADARLLGRIKDYVARLASPFAAIEVCNPVYEQIQVRCSVKLHPSAVGGASIKHINQAINQYLSPWTDQGRNQARFGWRIRHADIASYILGLECVSYLTQFSMLHIVQDKNDTYALFDTAGVQGATAHAEDIKPKYPWGIAVPLRHHYIETINDYLALEPRSAGIDELKIGETFIIS
ncbi:MAG: hypothetical protein HKP58_04365, partial [Desulfatitalea sp.]|nr:baseplate J/gp47 family protein [Desulfatitalea sp.]NNJ99625.1 hypothetical protein [Desulfatitalea sp.]